MKRAMTSVVIGGVLAFGLLGGCRGVQPANPARETPAVTPVTLSRAAADALKAEFPGRSVVQGVVWREDGVKSFTVHLTEGGKWENGYIVTVSDSGVIVDVIKPVPVSDLPKAVTDAVNAEGQGATVKRAIKHERRTDDKLVKLEQSKVEYGIELVKDGMHGDMAVAEDGKVLKPLKMKPASNKESLRSGREPPK